MRQVRGLPDLEGFLEIVFDLGDDGGEVELGLDELLALAGDVFAQAGIGGECDYVFSELDGITCLIGESVHDLLEQFGAAAGRGADDWQSAGHGLQRSEREGFFPFGGEEQGIMASVDLGHLLWSGAVKRDGKRLIGDKAGEHLDVVGVSFSVDV